MDGNMNKTELVVVVERVYNVWRETLPSAGPQRDSILKTWWRIIGDLDFNLTETALDSLIIADGYMPRPGTLRRAVVNMSGLDLPPTAAEAWQQFRVAAEAAHSGVYSPATIHACVRETIQRLGGTSSFGLSTNNDRNMFTETYGRVVLEWETEQYQKDSDEVENR